MGSDIIQSVRSGFSASKRVVSRAPVDVWGSCGPFDVWPLWPLSPRPFDVWGFTKDGSHGYRILYPRIQVQATCTGAPVARQKQPREAAAGLRNRRSCSYPDLGAFPHPG